MSVQSHTKPKRITRWLLVSASVLCAGAVSAQRPPAPPDGTLAITAAARQRGVETCLAKLEAMERNLFSSSEYTFRGFLDEREPNARPFTAIVDSRRKNSHDRALTNITVAPNATACTVMYEQTVYHGRHCDAVRKEMAPQASPATTKAIGAVIYDVAKNLSLTIIPVGDGQCVTVIKEIAY